MLRWRGRGIRRRKNMPEGMVSRKGGFRLIITIILVILAIIVLWVVCARVAAPKTEGYQAVFLSNGQVYFGKISKLNHMYVELNDIYYLQLRKPLQTQEPPAEGEATAQSKLTLMKLGKEIHGPKDEMIINRKHVLFIENLKDDSKVVEAIEQYQVQQAESEATVETAE